MLHYLFPARFRQWLGPLLVAAVAPLILAVTVVVSGWIDLSAARPHPDGWARFLHYTFARSTAHHAEGVSVPADLNSPDQIRAGALYYGQVCAHCHGGPGFGQNPIVLSMHPRPQYLASDLPGAGFTEAQLFRIVKGGVKYSAMPAWPVNDRDDEVWHLVSFLRILPGLSPEAFRRLAFPGDIGASDPAARTFGPPGPLRRYALRNDAEPPATSFKYAVPVFAFGEGSVDRGPLASCASCHGADGRGGGVFPNLTIQNEAYLQATLTAFASGQRNSGYMQMVASELSPNQIAALARYYSSLPRQASPARGTASPALIAQGRQIVLRGTADGNGVGGCAGCHGVDRAAAKAYPLLEGQSRWYIANQMRLFRDGRRGGLGNAEMSQIAHRLTDAEIDAIAAYYAAQPPEIVQRPAAKI